MIDIDPEDFRAWLKKNPDRKFLTGQARAPRKAVECNCPLSCYLREEGSMLAPFVGAKSVSFNREEDGARTREKLPKWLTRFVNGVDNAETKNGLITGDHAADFVAAP